MLKINNALQNQYDFYKFQCSNSSFADFEVNNKLLFGFHSNLHLISKHYFKQ